MDDRSALAVVLSRYFAAVDDKRLDADVVAATFTADGTIRRPDGSTLTGHTAILTGQNESFARFRATHHMLTDHLVDYPAEADAGAAREGAGDTARLRANMHAMHLWGDGHRDPAELASHFVAGGVMTATATRTPDGWRLRELAMRPVWRAGAALGMIPRRPR